MIVILDRAATDRLERIEAEEGIPKEELVRQAVEVWSRLTPEERRILGLAAMQLVAARLRGSR
ncbi:hypothetical protein [Antarcticirhabdus aurantiaca]|uniref:Uncharacterized protein n=1 Tax=Antarcticirhabdus aurantiaca TaxID=2606717 RepID=A0ACD4NNU9_9HYPH|nr:hypothetical protein [Antarcticirhabdus aurantiaca]WAJ28432.1 hypothetical protein OXU80_27095 [Jeongeuplla avenae]